MKYRIIKFYRKINYREENEAVYKIQYKNSGWLSWWENYSLNYSEYSHGVKVNEYTEIQIFKNIKEAREALSRLKERLEYKKIIL